MDNTEYGSGSQLDQAIEYQTLSSNISVDKFERPERLHEWLKSEEIELLHESFVEKGKLSYAELRDELELLNVTFSDMEYNRLFLKINQNRDFKCDWNEFISYLIFGFQEDDPSSQKEALIMPISTPPMIRKSEHRSAVCALSLLKTVSDLIVDVEEEEVDKLTDDEDVDEEAEEEERKMADLAINDTPDNTGLWITASKEGQIRFWTPHFEPIRSGMSESCTFTM